MTKATRCFLLFLFLIVIYDFGNPKAVNLSFFKAAWAQDFDESDFADEDSADNFEDEDFDEESSELAAEVFDDEKQYDDFESEEVVAGDGDGDEFDDDFGDDSEIDDFGESFASDEESSDGFDAFDDQDALAIEESTTEEDQAPFADSLAEDAIEPADTSSQAVTGGENVSAENYDLDFENKLFKIYDDFYKYPVSESEWKNLTGDRRSEVYEIQNGDTLWDISTTFFGDGHYWPKIWSVNGRITNPHIISTGNSILFNFGDINSPPTFSVENEGSANIPDLVDADGNPISPNENSAPSTTLPGGAENDSELDINNNLIASNEPVKIPPTRLKINPVIRTLPGSLPSWGYYGGNNKNSFEAEKRVSDHLVNRKVNITHFIRDKPITDSGKMIEAEAGEKFATTGQYIYVEMPVSSNASRYIVANALGLVKPKIEGAFIEGPYGYVYEVQGVIEVREPIENNSKKSTKKDKKIYRAYVESAFNPLKAGSILLDQEHSQIEISSSVDFNYTESQITGGSSIVGSRVLGVGMFAYINKGSLDGFVEGDKVAIIPQRKIRRSVTRLSARLHKIGEGQIVDVSDKVATVLITKAFGEIMVGDFIGEPQLGLGGQSMGGSENQSFDLDEDFEGSEDIDGFDSDEGSDQEFDSEDGLGSDELSDDFEDSFGEEDDQSESEGFDIDDEDENRATDNDIDFDEEDDFSEGDIDSDEF